MKLCRWALPECPKGAKWTDKLWLQYGVEIGRVQEAVGKLTGHCINLGATRLTHKWLRDRTKPPWHGLVSCELFELLNLKGFDFKPAEIKHNFLHTEENASQSVLGTGALQKAKSTRACNRWTGTQKLQQTRLHMSTQHTQLTKQLKAVFGGGTKKENTFVNIIQKRRIIHLQTKMMLLSLWCKEATRFTPCL